MKFSRVKCSRKISVFSACLYANLRNLGTMFAFPGLVVPRTMSHTDISKVHKATK